MRARDLAGFGSKPGAAVEEAGEEPGAAAEEPGAADEEPGAADAETGAAEGDATESELAACICFGLGRR
jgi:hypothetical protein